MSRARPRALVLAAVLAPLAGCVPSSQVLLHVDTDAPVPPDPADPPDPLRPPWLFDRLRIEVLRDGAPAAEAGVVRDFAVHEGLFRAVGVSMGIAPPVGDTGLSARVRLFRADRLVAGEPPPGATLDVTVRLPELGAHGSVTLTAFLAVEDVGRPVGRPDPIEASPGPPPESRVGTWPGARRVPCRGAAAPDEACVSGGAFWMGDPRMRLGEEGLVKTEERLVVVSPFFIDLREVTVGAFRKRWPTLGGRFMPRRRDPSQDPSSAASWCTWTERPAGLEVLPLNCVPRETAQLYCRALGRDLPSEAQWEFVASGRGAERAYPWGDDEPRCEDAAWGRGGGGGLDSAEKLTDSRCRPSADLGGVVAPGAGLRDRVVLDDPASGAATVVDLAGNVGELVADVWSRLDEGSWTAPGVRVDPVATAPSDTDPDLTDTYRGGSWRQSPYELRAGFRAGAPENLVSSGIGLRCARRGD